MEAIRDQLKNLERCLNKIEYSLQKLGTPKDTETLRKKLAQDRERGTQLLRAIVRAVKENKPTTRDIVARNAYSQLVTTVKSTKARFEDLNQRCLEKEREFNPAPRREPRVGGFEYDMTPAQPQSSQSGGAQSQAMATHSADLQMMQDQNADLRGLEQDINAVHDIFRDFDALVDQGQEGLDAMEHNVTEAHAEMVKGNENLEKASDHQKSARKKMCCILCIVIIIAFLLLGGALGGILGGIFGSRRH
eukprot:gnl/Trimastix_PCT/2570.p1 GENE.gnl/Trimastix_PCT/2570~~gnl/Trimastix_PCT/2570.p1  ORF type:complete len:248 (-),score=66.13 gnl/Trimastix_PCT/2570:723-1466(-)